jgi:hypothetical protein
MLAFIGDGKQGKIGAAYVFIQNNLCLGLAC